jgi:uncharacterized membrane protein
MGSLPLHPAMVHVPLGLAFVVPFLAAGLAWALWRERLPRRAWTILVALQAVLVAGGLAALQTGEREEGRVEAIVGEAAIGRHEAMAKQFVWAAGVTLVLAAAALLVKASGAVRALTAAATLASFVAMALAIRVGHAGGELVYRQGAAAAYVSAAGTSLGTSTLNPAVPRPGHRAADDDD